MCATHIFRPLSKLLTTPSPSVRWQIRGPSGRKSMMSKSTRSTKWMALNTPYVVHPAASKQIWLTKTDNDKPYQKNLKN